MSFAQEAFEQRTPHDVVMEAVSEFVDRASSPFSAPRGPAKQTDPLERITDALFSRRRLVLAEWPEEGDGFDG